MVRGVHLGTPPIVRGIHLGTPPIVRGVHLRTHRMVRGVGLGTVEEIIFPGACDLLLLACLPTELLACQEDFK